MRNGCREEIGKEAFDLIPGVDNDISNGFAKGHFSLSRRILSTEKVLNGFPQLYAKVLDLLNRRTTGVFHLEPSFFEECEHAFEPRPFLNHIHFEVCKEFGNGLGKQRVHKSFDILPSLFQLGLQAGEPRNHLFAERRESRFGSIPKIIAARVGSKESYNGFPQLFTKIGNASDNRFKEIFDAVPCVFQRIAIPHPIDNGAAPFADFIDKFRNLSKNFRQEIANLGDDAASLDLIP